MKITLESTDQMQSFEGVTCRIWKGISDGGVEIIAFIRCISPQTHDESKLAIFDKELKALPPVRKELVSFDYRMFAD